MAPWIEYCTVNTTSPGSSVNWPRNAKFCAPSGITLGRSSGTRRLNSAEAVRHHHSGHIGGDEHLVEDVLEAELVDQLGEDLRAGRLRHLLRDVVPFVVDLEAVTPQRVGILLLLGEVRLGRHDHRQVPTRLDPRGEGTGARLVAGVLGDALEQRVTVHRESERLPLVLVDVAVEGVGPTEVRGLLGDLLPQRPAMVDTVTDQRRNAVIAAVCGVSGDGSDGHEREVIRAELDRRAAVRVLGVQAGGTARLVGSPMPALALCEDELASLTDLERDRVQRISCL